MWEYIPFENCLEKTKIKFKLPKKDYRESGEYPIVSQEENLISGYHDDISYIFKVAKPIVVFGDHTLALKYIDFDFIVGADGVKILQPKKTINSKYFYYVLKALMPKTTGYARHYKLLKKLDIPLPPLEEQKRIVAKLDAAFAEIDEAIELTALKKEEINKFKCSILNINNKKNDFYNSALNNWEELKIGDICDLMTGGTPSRKVPEYFDKGEIKWLVSGDINQKEIFDCDGRITEEGFNNSSVKFLPKNSVLIALNGQGKTRGTVAILRTKATCNQSLVSIFPKPGVNLNTKYLYYFLEGMYDKIRRITGDSGNDRRGLNMPLIRNIKILLPTIKEQENIISKLEIVINELDIANGVLKESTKNYEALKSAILLKELQPSEAA
jgi:restriction endonuclease S subunit